MASRGRGRVQKGRTPSKGLYQYGEPKMSELPEKRVMRRKRELLATNLHIEDEFVDSLFTNGLINAAGSDQILGEKPGVWQIHKLVDVFLAKAGSVNKFSDLLDDSYEALAEELRAEMKAEKGELTIEDHIYQEAGKLVHREFGSIRRLSEMDKKDMQTLVALRTQYAKEVWRLRLDKARKELENLQKSNREKDEHTAELAEAIGRFVGAHRRRVDKKVPTTSDPPKLMSREKTMTENMKTGKLMMETLEEHVNSLLTLTSQSLQEKESLHGERGRALRVLGLEDDNARLDDHLRILMSAYESKLKNSVDEANYKAKMAQALDGQIRSLKDEKDRAMNEKEKMIEALQEHLRKSQDRLLHLQQEGDALRKELSTVRIELHRIKEMVLQLETTRRLGFKFKAKPNDTFVSTRLKSIPVKGTTHVDTVAQANAV